MRIAHQGHELLSAGQMTLPLPEPERARLMAVRRGEMPLAEVLERLGEQTERLQRIAQARSLPQQPDHDAADRFLTSAYQRAWAERASPHGRQDHAVLSRARSRDYCSLLKWIQPRAG